MTTKRNVGKWLSHVRTLKWDLKEPWSLHWQQLVVALSVWLLTTIVFTATLFAQRIDVSVGDLAPRTIVAPYGVVDWGATAKAREQAAKSVPNVYTTNNQVLKNQENTIRKDFSLILSLSLDQAAPLSLREQTVAQAIPVGLPNSVWGEVLSLSPSSLSQLQQDALVIVSSVMGNGNGVRNNQVGLAEAKGFSTQLASQEESQPGLRLFLADFTKSLIVPNTFLNVQDTQAKKEAAMARVPIVKILKGEQVLQAGQVVTPADIKVLQELGLLDQGFNPAPVVGSALVSLVLVALLSGYLWFLKRPLLNSLPSTIITGIIFTASLIAADVMKGLPALNYLVVPTAAIMVTALVDSGLGMVMAGVLALGMATLTGADLNVALVSFFGGLAGVFGVSRLSQRYDIIRAGLLVGIVNLMTLLGLDIMEGAGIAQTPTWETLLWGLLDGVLAAILAMGSIPFLEGPFGIITSMKLIELSNPNQPLLRKLLVEAPGTYHHSIMVGNLAEQATEAVGGNSLLARVGAYYHDIGKSKRPYFFVDNQFGADNPHDKLAPALSALIISSHVRDGIELARQYHIPDAIINFIREHHGTTLISFFYHKALQADTGEGVLEEDYRYDGPRPQSKETAIVMLADASEATSRTLKQPTPQAIEQVVRKIIKDRLEDGQLDESNLTLKELDIIARTFVRVLTGVFHQRIEYPEKVLKEMERSHSHGHMGGKSSRFIRRIGGDRSTGSHRSSR
ncbi:HD family phosphohydrolase [Sulfobacillus thermosulfidooxidans]|uniref:HD family phosphohydrolase n=1 Tax=Sulfobacillus thermosulfidooxidans TaxID=28034 RepID=UPI0006B58C9F|nr:HDIG domain-containing metalloprotein [Sulfobacillus thermosulfidooxidans]